MRRLIILTEGFTEPIAAKTASNVLRYRPHEVVALLDGAHRGQTAQQLLGVGGSTPVVARLDEAPQANTLLIGVAFAAGRLPARWRQVILQAVGLGLDVVSGMHHFLADDPEIASLAASSGSRLFDVRRNDEREVASGRAMRENCLRVHTVGQDCCVGKMVVALELSQALVAQGHDAKFVATGQTGIIVEGDGCPIDCVVSDFVSGAAERLVLANQRRDILLIEGQGAISHPRYSAVTLGLLHGCAPHAMILCYEAGRTAVIGMPHIPLQPLGMLRKIYEMMAGLVCPSRVIGVAVNSRRLSDAQATAERERVRNELGLPVCDVLRDGASELTNAVLRMRSARQSFISSSAS
jgi:uncharacterized NAD-dependent epimerase/dehydratase family protein